LANPWDAEDDEDFPGEGEEVVEQPVAATEEQAEEEVAEEVVADASESAPEGEEAAGEVDPDAWRNLRVTDHPGEVLRSLRELAERHPATKRALGTVAAEYARREYDPVINQHREARVKAEEESRNLKIQMGNFMFKAADEANDPKLHSALHNNPNLNAQYQEWKALTGQPAPRDLLSDPVVRGAAEELDQMIIDAGIAGVDDSYIEWLQGVAVTELRKAKNPYEVVKRVEATIDARIREMQNGGDTNGQPARATAAKPAAVAPKPVPTTVSKGTNANVGKFAPASAPRTGGTGKSLPKIKESMLDGYYLENPEEFDKMLERYGVADSNELKKRGFVAVGQ